ncbi:MAG: Hsp33 family molecular chaperone HslO [Burkholderiaceae bacterium]
MTDRLTRFMLGPRVRGQWLDLQASWAHVLSRHQIPPLAAQVLGELTAASLLLTGTLKQQGSLTAQIVGGHGPARLIVVECQADGRFRSVLKPSPDAHWPDQADDLMRLLDPASNARFVVTLDPKRKGSPAYQGIVPLEGASIAGALERYMERSEQLPTRLWLAADGKRAAGLLLQRLPESAGIEADADTWERVQTLADTLAPDEILGIEAEQAMHRLFWQETVSALETRAIRFECSCSRARVADMLRMLGQAEVEDIIAEQKTVEVDCDYCNAHYSFDEVDAGLLFTEHALEAPKTRQ